MKILLVVFLVLISAPIAQAEQYRMNTEIFDIEPGDGLCDAGSELNPWVIFDESGNEIGTVHSENPDLYPGDGFMDAGTYSNPYVFDTDD